MAFCVKIKAVKKVFYLLFITLVLLGIRFYKPKLWDDLTAKLVGEKSAIFNQSILGANDRQSEWEKGVSDVLEHIGHIPLVEEAVEKTTREVNKQIEILKVKPQNEAEKVKEQVKETVCEDWLK